MNWGGEVVNDTRCVRATTRKLEAEAERLEKDGNGWANEWQLIALTLALRDK